MSTTVLDLTIIKVRKVFLKILHFNPFLLDHDHHHFDNPVYSTYRNSTPLSGTPLNNARLHNRIVKNINSEREKASVAAASCARLSSSFIEEDDISDTTSERGKDLEKTDISRNCTFYFEISINFDKIV